MELTLQTRVEGEFTVVEVGGEIDVYTAPKLRDLPGRAGQLRQTQPDRRHGEGRVPRLHRPRRAGRWAGNGCGPTTWQAVCWSATRSASSRSSASLASPRCSRSTIPWPERWVRPAEARADDRWRVGACVDSASARACDSLALLEQCPRGWSRSGFSRAHDCSGYAWTLRRTDVRDHPRRCSGQWQGLLARAQPGHRLCGGGRGCLRASGGGVPRQGGPTGRRGHRENEGDRDCDSGRRLGVPDPAVQNPGCLRRGPGLLSCCVRLACGLLEGKERIGRSIFFLVGAVFSGITGYVGMWLAVRANVRVAAAARVGKSGEQRGHPDRLPYRWCGRHVHRRPRPARRLDRGAHLQGRSAQGVGGLRLRRGPAGNVHACRRRHLHQGRRRRRGLGRQGRAGHPRGRPPQRRHHRGQRR